MRRSWKTTLAGLLGGIAILVGGAVQNRANDPNASPITAGNVLPAIAISVLGALAKDHDVTGGKLG